MPEIIETTVYRLDRLSEDGEGKRPGLVREGAEFDHDWFRVRLATTSSASARSSASP